MLITFTPAPSIRVASMVFSVMESLARDEKPHHHLYSNTLQVIIHHIFKEVRLC